VIGSEGAGGSAGGERVVLVVDRSIPVGRDNMAEVIKWRRSVAMWLAGRPSVTLAGIVVFAETARLGAMAELEDGMCDLRYGSNLEHALDLARDLCVEMNTNRMVIVAYSAPSAHRVRTGEVFFTFPPVIDSITAAAANAERCRQAGLAIDAIVLDEPDDEPDEHAMTFSNPFRNLPATFTVLTKGLVIGAPLDQPTVAIRRAMPTS